MSSPYLRQLYQLYLAEDDAPQGLVTQEAYQMLMQKGVACEEQLLDALPPDERCLVGNLEEVNTNLQHLHEEFAFSLGFRLGAGLILECIRQTP